MATVTLGYCAADRRLVRWDCPGPQRTAPLQKSVLVKVTRIYNQQKLGTKGKAHPCVSVRNTQVRRSDSLPGTQRCVGLLLLRPALVLY